MNKENTQKLLADFPVLYCANGLFHDFGFQCGDGWFQLIYELSNEITVIATETNSPLPVVSQVKEKFGELRFYCNKNTDGIKTALNKATRKSSVTCEKCGSQGKLILGRWSRVRCEPCDLEDQQDLIKSV